MKFHYDRNPRRANWDRARGYASDSAKHFSSWCASARRAIDDWIQHHPEGWERLLMALRSWSRNSNPTASTVTSLLLFILLALFGVENVNGAFAS